LLHTVRADIIIHNQVVVKSNDVTVSYDLDEVKKETTFSN